MLYRDIDYFWGLVGDAVDKGHINGWFAVIVFLAFAPLWYPFWFASKLINNYLNRHL